jgi:hypothetical protein
MPDLYGNIFAFSLAQSGSFSRFSPDKPGEKRIAIMKITRI